jgi:endogenous inhibitor of DNA gyrase (YacG/DUF329 family)
MIRGRCPICSRPIAIASMDDLPSFPFCSDRCKLIDLGRWIDGAYAIPAAADEEKLEDEEEDDEAIDERR